MTENEKVNIWTAAAMLEAVQNELLGVINQIHERERDASTILMAQVLIISQIKESLMAGQDRGIN